MKSIKHNLQLSTLLILVILIFTNAKQKQEYKTIELKYTNAQDLLPSWNESTIKRSIIDFVTKTTKQSGPDFVPVADRIACFDNDGTLWGEQPFYFQLFFAIDRIKAMAPEHPEWKTTQPYQALLSGDIKTVLAGGEKAIGEIIMTTHTGMTTDQFENIVMEWMSNATHPVIKKHYNEMVYQPMLELLNYLRANEYKTFIVSGGGIDFMRVWTEKAYGIPPYQVIGSSGKVKYDNSKEDPVILKLPGIGFIDDKDGKPAGIYQHIGKRPVFTVGNSDGDYEMLQWTSTAKGYPRFSMLIHHTDSIREWAYDRKSSIGHLEKGLDDAPKYKWMIADMKYDWKKIYPFDK